MKEKKQLSLPPEKIKFENSEKLQKKEPVSIEKKIFLVRIIINIIFSLILIATFCLLWTSYSPVWKIFFFLTVWSFWSNTFYIISITIMDILLYKEYKKCEKFNEFIRNDLIRIIFPFSISTIFIYWELVLLGDAFQGIGHSILDISKSFFLHGLVFVFMCFDAFTSKHINKKNNCNKDVIIISIIMAIHFAIVILVKEVLNVHSYDFLIIADVRQIIGSFIILYIIVLNGYIVFYLISDNFFLKEEISDINYKNDKDEDSGDKLKLYDENDSAFSGLNKKILRDLRDKNGNNNYLKAKQNNIKSSDENIKVGNDKESINKEKKEDNCCYMKDEMKKSESDKYEISDKESNKEDVFEKKLDEYAVNFFKINSISNTNKINENRELLNIKKTKLGIKDIKIPQNTIETKRK